LGGNLKGRQADSLPMIGEHAWRIIDTAEDGMLAEFTTCAEACGHWFRSAGA